MNAMRRSGTVLALSGGVGGAKLALGLARVLPAEQLVVVANTADDFEHLGLPISPDLDTVMYTLAGRNNTQQGWGLAGESWQMMDALAELGGDTWFRLGDRDLATHLLRGERLRAGQSLSAVTEQLCMALGVRQRLLPMTDDRVRTRLHTDQGELDFQDYFVHRQCEPAVSGVRFEGIESARPQSEFLRLLHSDTLRAVLICPSNPFVSVAPILALPQVREALQRCSAPVIAVSPIVGGQALKGPASKMMQELRMPATAQAVAAYYGDLLDGFVVDSCDAEAGAELQAQGLSVQSLPTVMRTLEDRIALAEAVLRFAHTLAER